MNKKDVLKLLRRLKACDTSEIERSKYTNGYDLWRTNTRGDHLLWFAAKISVDHKKIVLAACDCAELSLKFVPDGEDRPRMTIETARRWCRGEATKDEVRSAAADAADAADAANAANVAAYAATAAADAADAAHDADDAAAYAAAATGERSKCLKECATITRRHISWADIKTALAEGDCDE